MTQRLSRNTEVPASLDKLRKVLTQADYETAKTGHQFFDAATEALYQRIQAKLPGYEITLQSQTLNK